MTSIMYYRPIHLAICLYIPTSAYQKGSLTRLGAFVAGCMALVTLWLCPSGVFAAALLSFFFTGSKATKYKASYKARLEEQDGGHSSTSSPSSPKRDTSSGNRDHLQVLCNGLPGTLACLLWIARFGDAFGFLQGANVGGKVGTSCPLSTTAGGSRSDDALYSNILVYAAVGFWAACMGDTLSSELGMLAKSAPRLITTFQPVAPGTNGGVTAWGTAVSFFGGAFIGIIASLTLLIENKACRDAGSSTVFISLIVVSAFAGLIGSLLDSLLGATLQQTLYSKARKMVIHKLPEKSSSREKEDIQIRGLDILDNNQVNAVSTSIVCLACAWLGAKM